MALPELGPSQFVFMQLRGIQIDANSFYVAFSVQHLFLINNQQVGSLKFNGCNAHISITTASDRHARKDCLVNHSQRAALMDLWEEIANLHLLSVGASLELTTNGDGHSECFDIIADCAAVWRLLEFINRARDILQLPRRRCDRDFHLSVRLPANYQVVLR